MMSQNLATAEAGGQPEQNNWWVAKWSGWLATIGALVLAFISVLGIGLNLLTLSPTSALASALQL